MLKETQISLYELATCSGARLFDYPTTQPAITFYTTQKLIEDLESRATIQIKPEMLSGRSDGSLLLSFEAVGQDYAFVDLVINEEWISIDYNDLEEPEIFDINNLEMIERILKCYQN